MVPTQSFDEIRVYEGFAERTGVHFEKDEVRRSERCCNSLTALLRKGRASGEGYFYLPLKLWPADTDRIELQKKWIVMSSLPPDGFPQ